MDTTKRKARAATVSVASNASLVAGKLAIGLVTGSVSVLSEAIHSAVDLLAAGIALFAVKTANKPADKEHAYGHGKIENISGTVEAVLIFLAAAWIVFEAVHKLLARSPVEMPGLGVAVMACSSVANWLVSRMLFRVGKETDSIALQADAWHLRTDVWTSAGVMAGLLVIMVAGYVAPALDLWWLDPVAAMAVALLIVKAAWDLTRESFKDVIDEALPEDEQRWVREQARAVPGALGIHGLRTRKAGAQRFMDLHLLVDPGMSVERSHELAHALDDAVEKRFPGASVTVHVEPCDGRCEPACLEGCLLDPAGREARRSKKAG